MDQKLGTKISLSESFSWFLILSEWKLNHNKVNQFQVFFLSTVKGVFDVLAKCKYFVTNNFKNLKKLNNEYNNNNYIKRKYIKTWNTSSKKKKNILFYLI